MKKEQVPQDLGSLGKITTEICYATDESGKYTTQQSQGWEVKTGALDVTWENIEKKAAAAREKVERGEASPLLFFMEKKLMTVPILAGYTGIWRWRIRRHLRPEIFRRLPNKLLNRYATAFECTVEELKSMSLNG
jgi:hypothetical protein